jgi:hypothetical protein
VGERFRPNTTTHKDRESSQMHMIRVVLLNISVPIEDLEYIFEDRKSGTAQDDCITIFTEENWTHIVTPPPWGESVLISSLSTITKKFVKEESILTFDNWLKTLSDLSFRPIDEVNVGGKEDDPTILETPRAGHLIFSPRLTTDGNKITRLTGFKDIPTIPTCQSIQLTKIPGLKRPESALEHLFDLLEQDMTLQVEDPTDVIVWIYAPYLDMILLLNKDIIKDFLPKHATDTNSTSSTGLCQVEY